MFLFIYRLFCGYLYVRVKAKNPEKILNLASAKGLGVWRVTAKEDTLYFKIGIHSFKKLRIFKRKIPCKIHITKKIGFPFFVAKNRKRYGMAVGMLIFFAILYLMSGYVWNICISGNKEIKSEEILSSLNQIGIYEGARISDIEPEEKRNELLLLQDGLAWAAINIEGSKITVDVTETKEKDSLKTDPSNLIANEDGIIKKIEVKSGVIKTKVGDAVQKGQMLVAGIREYEDGRMDFTRSVGNIYAEVDYSFSTVQPLKVKEFLKTGEEYERKVLSIFGVKIPLYLGNIEGTYETAANAEKISSGKSYLPIKIISKKFYKTKEVTYTLNEDRAKIRAQKIADKKISELVGSGEIINKHQKIVCDGNTFTINTRIKCLKDIVFEENLLLDTSN